MHPSCLCSTPVSPPGMRACLLHFREFEPRVRHRPGFTVAVAVLEPPRSGGLGDVLCWVSAVPRPDAAVGSKWAFCMQRRRGGRYRGCAGRVCAGRCRLTPKLAGLQLQYILRPGRKRGAFGEGSTAMTGPSAARQRCLQASGCGHFRLSDDKIGTNRSFSQHPACNEAHLRAPATDAFVSRL